MSGARAKAWAGLLGGAVCGAAFLLLFLLGLRAQGQRRLPLPEDSPPVREVVTAGEPAQETPPIFSSPLLVSDPSSGSFDSRIAVDATGNIHVVWDGGAPGCSSHISYARSSDGGQTFSTPVNLSNVGCRDNAGSADLAVDPAGNLYVAWTQFNEDQLPPNQVYFTRSTDGGQTFTEPRDISHSVSARPVNGAILPRLAAGAPGHIYVVWIDRGEDVELPLPQVFFSFSKDGGETFSERAQLSFHTELLQWGSFPYVAADAASGRVYVGWKNVVLDSRVKLFVRRSWDGGQTFAEPVLLTHAGSLTGLAGLDVDAAGTLYAVWIDAGRNYLKRSRDGGLTFSKRKRVIPQRVGVAFVLGVAAGGPRRLYLVWITSAEQPIRLRYSTNGGRSFRGNFNVSGDMGDIRADVAVDVGGNACVVFGGPLLTDPFQGGIYFTRSLQPLP